MWRISYPFWEWNHDSPSPYPNYYTDDAVSAANKTKLLWHDCPNFWGVINPVPFWWFSFPFFIKKYVIICWLKENHIPSELHSSYTSIRPTLLVLWKIRSMNLANTASDFPLSKFHFSLPLNRSFQKKQYVALCNRRGSSLKFHTLQVPRRHLDALF